MKIIKRLKHDDKVMIDSLFGWDIFWCRDYDNLDRNFEKDGLYEENPKFGYTLIFAFNLFSYNLFKRFFIRIK